MSAPPLSPMQALREAFLEADLEELFSEEDEQEMAGGDDDGAMGPNKNSGGGSGLHWRSAWAEDGQQGGEGGSGGVQREQRGRVRRSSRVGQHTMSSANQARVAPLAQPSRDDVRTFPYCTAPRLLLDLCA